jgi:hypothetical protein
MHFFGGRFAFLRRAPQCEWGSNGLAALFAQKRNAGSPAFLRMLSELPAFQRDVLRRVLSLHTALPLAPPAQHR